MSTNYNPYWCPVGRRMCACCRQHCAPKGLYLPKLSVPGALEWMCEDCIVSARSPMVIALVFEGHLSLTSQARAAEVMARGCPQWRPLQGRGRRRTLASA